MTDWLPRKLRETALAEVEARLAAAPADADAGFERACLLAELGEIEAAKAAYLDLLARVPNHAGALNNLGTLLHAASYRRAARTVYAQAAAAHPDDPMGHVNLANLLFEEEEAEGARAHYETALRLAPDHAEAHRGLAILLAEQGEAAQAAYHRDRAFGTRPVTTLPYRGVGAPLPLLLLVSVAGGNVPFSALLDDRIFLTHVAVAEYVTPETPLPAHRLVVNAVGDSDLCRPALERVSALLAGGMAPVVNPPAVILPTGRLDNARRLGALPGVVTPAGALLPRAILAGPGVAAVLAREGLGFPLLLRTPGYHTGRHFQRIAAPEDLPAALAALPGDELLALQYLDAKAADGCARKYRVMTIGGRLYPLHLAIARQWKVHYYTSDMAAQEAYRAEEAAFLADMPGVLGAEAMAALERVNRALGLDYGGVDFALDAKGRLLLFEANATMIAAPPPPDGIWAYRRPAFDRVRAAAQALLLARAQG